VYVHPQNYVLLVAFIYKIYGESTIFQEGLGNFINFS